MTKSHTLDGSELKVQRLVSDQPFEVFQKVTARVNFDSLRISSPDSRHALRVLKDKAKVSGDASSIEECVLTGTFDQMKSAHDVLQGMLNTGSPFQQTKGSKKKTIPHGDSARTEQNSSQEVDTEVKGYPDTNYFNSFEVQPQFMKLLKQVYKTKFQEIEEMHGVNILWSENASQVHIRPANADDPGSCQQGSDKFINLYQALYPKMRREEIELERSDDKELVTEGEIRSMECENDVVIEMEENKLVVYAEENIISVAIPALKKALGLSRGSSNKTRSDRRNTNRYAISQQVLSQDLKNGVKLALYQGDITSEKVDAIVNAANEWLQHAGGVAAAIARRGGRQIEDESRRIISKRNGHPLSVGDAVHTMAGNLPCRFVVHTVGPRWNSYEREKCTSLLYHACMESLYLAAKLELCSIALPPISSGIFGMPKEICANVIFGVVEDFSTGDEVEFTTLRDVRIVIIDDETISIFYDEFAKRYASSARNEGQSDEEREHFPAIATGVDQTLLSSQTRGEDLPNANFKSNENVDPKQQDVEAAEYNGNQLEDIAKTGESSTKDNESKSSLPVDIEMSNTGGMMADGMHGKGKGKGLQAPSLVKSTNGTSKTAATKPSGGRGRGVLAIKFPGRASEEERETRLHFEHETNPSNVRIGRGITYDTDYKSPPGLAVTDEGKHLAQTGLSELVSDDPNTKSDPSVDRKKDAGVNNSNNHTLRKGDQTSLHSNQMSDKDNINGESSLAYSKSNKENASRLNMSPDDSTTDREKTGKESREESLTGSEQKRPKDENANAYKPYGGQPGTEMDMEVDQSVVGEEHSDVTSRQDSLASSQSPSNNGQQTVPDEIDPVGGNSQTSSAEARVEPRLEMHQIHQRSERDCTICMNHHQDPVYVLPCGHYFCKSCISRFIEKSRTCPQCKQEKLFRGNQPMGYMTWRTETRKSLPGYENDGTIVVTYNFNAGIQGSQHQNPGQPYRESFCTSYLPDNSAGREVCNLLRRAFNGRLIFTIGKCSLTGEENIIFSNGIELKTNRSGGPANYGYPDHSYLDRVRSQLSNKGITQIHDQTLV